jgi:nitrous oxide reductase accessory protein NosL
MLKLLGIVLILSAATPALAEHPKEGEHNSAATPALANLPKDVEHHPSCAMCEMNRGQFAHSRALVEWEDGTKTGLCSINCVVAVTSQDPNRKLKSVRVADYDTKQLLDAATAVWVVGGSVKGVMTPEPKWAFATKEAAEGFIKKNGGEIVTYDEAHKRAKENVKMKHKKT